MHEVSIHTSIYTIAIQKQLYYNMHQAENAVNLVYKLSKNLAPNTQTAIILQQRRANIPKA